MTKSSFDILPLPTDSTVYYFKIKNNWKDSTPDALDTFTNRWYSRMLFALKEPILNNYKGSKEIYRFTWLRTFYRPVSVRMEKQGESVKLFAKACDGAGGYEPGQLVFDTTMDITMDQYKLLEEKINKLNLWEMPTEDRDNTGEDGSEWIYEAVKDNHYHMVTRWTPKDNTFRSVGEYLLSLPKNK